MPIFVKAVSGKPYGKTPRVCLQIESGYRAGERPDHHWLSRSEAEKWARETGYTVLDADTRASSALLVNLFETFSDFQFENREISGADLVDELGGWLRKHKATVGSMAAPEADPGAEVLKDLFRLFRPVHSGDDEVNGGDLVGNFGEWLLDVQERMPAITGTHFVPKVARHPDRSEYWSEAGGWGDLESATAYFVNAPAGLKRNVLREWIDVELAVELETGAEFEVDAGPGPRA
ncbi:hypothetical protein [Variovorax sp. RA8]|uniref:hypothetical protein n=1 Tax=Variovorax sp. (strain JCM 16519 / RA8) TaxID=662548 RepID=UPI00131869D2|nr:hypothetical protein [Variovorax sp. RA8]VTU44153.1 hypothetical protein RA8P2_00059 [Variovorax sp. RA8]